MRTSFSARLPDQTIEQIKTLAEKYDDSQAHIIILAVDRMYQQEIEMSKIFYDKELTGNMVSSVEIKNGKVVNQFTWIRGGNGGLVNEDKSLVGKSINELSGYSKR